MKKENLSEEIKKVSSKYNLSLECQEDIEDLIELAFWLGHSAKVNFTIDRIKEKRVLKSRGNFNPRT